MLPHFSFTLDKVLEIFPLDFKGLLLDIVFHHFLCEFSLHVLFLDNFIGLFLVYFTKLLVCLVYYDLLVVFEGGINLAFVADFADHSHLLLVLLSSFDCESINEIFTV